MLPKRKDAKSFLPIVKFDATPRDIYPGRSRAR